MISNVRLQHFRSYIDSVFEFGDGVNIIVGPNGSGKTNLLEALLVLARGSSYRAIDVDLVEFTAEWTRLDANIDGASDRTVIIKTTLPPQKKYIVGEKSFSRLSEKQKLPVVLFEPNHLSLLYGSPEGRRNYLDDVLEQIKPGFASFRKNYKRVVTQRNALLKKPHTPKQEYFPWNLRLSELGAVIHRARRELINELDALFSDLYKQLSKTDNEVRLQYESRIPDGGYESKLLALLEENHSNDVERGFTSLGPHREDFTVFFDGVPAAQTASRGEIRTATLALKILEVQIIEHNLQTKPFLLLDDVFSELDGTRRRALTIYLQRYQTFLSTTDADIVVKHFTSSTIIPLTQNRQPTQTQQ